MTDDSTHSYETVADAAAAYRRRALILGLNDYVGAPRPDRPITDHELRENPPEDAT